MKELTQAAELLMKLTQVLDARASLDESIQQIQNEIARVIQVACTNAGGDTTIAPHKAGRPKGSKDKVKRKARTETPAPTPEPAPSHRPRLGPVPLQALTDIRSGHAPTTPPWALGVLKRCGYISRENGRWIAA